MENFSGEPRQRQGLQGEKAQTMSLLINSVYYFLECVFILRLPQRYRLVVLHHGRVLTDACFKTLRGARIAFSRLYGDKAWKEGVKARWSHFYNPDIQWLDKKISDPGHQARP